MQLRYDFDLDAEPIFDFAIFHVFHGFGLKSPKGGYGNQRVVWGTQMVHNAAWFTRASLILAIFTTLTQSSLTHPATPPKHPKSLFFKFKTEAKTGSSRPSDLKYTHNPPPISLYGQGLVWGALEVGSWPG